MNIDVQGVIFIHTLTLFLVAGPAFTFFVKVGTTMRGLAEGPEQC
jgi:hypothetical protein